MNLAIVADTHIPSRAGEIPAPFRDRIAAADRTIHAGDFVSAEALAAVRELAGDLTAVTGNMDRGLDLPAVAAVDLDGVTVAVTHGTGPPAGYEERVIETARDLDATVAVAGHTHEVVDRTRGGVRVLNPGSATGAPPADRTTMLTATVAEGALDVTVHEP